MDDELRLLHPHWLAEGVGVKGIRTNESFVSIELAPGYSLSQWRNDNAVDHDERLYFKRVITYAPYLVSVRHEVREQAITSEVFVGRRSALGLQATVADEGDRIELGIR